MSDVFGEGAVGVLAGCLVGLGAAVLILLPFGIDAWMSQRRMDRLDERLRKEGL